MTIWILAFVLLASLAAMGYRQGAVRVAFSLVGIFIAALLCVPLAGLVRPALAALGVANPALLWVLPPFVVFIVVLIPFKVGAMAVHTKIDVYYRHKAGDLRFKLWERINARLGLCLGLLNGLVYLVLLSFVIYAFGYWTTQIATNEDDPRAVRILNRLAWDLQATKMNKVAGAVQGMNADYYEAADIAGLLYQNSLLESRLSRYPAFLSLGERAEFQAIGGDNSISELRLRRAPIRELMGNPNIDVVVKSPEMLNTIWDTVKPDLADLKTFLETKKSPKYDGEPVHGRWSFDVNSTMAIYRKAKPNLPSSEVRKYKNWLALRFIKTSLIAGTDHVLVVKDLPVLKAPQPGQPPQPIEMKSSRGNWSGADGAYELTMDGEQRTAKIEGDKLSFKVGTVPVVFEKD